MISPAKLKQATTMSFRFFLNDPPTTETYTLSLHDALPISDQDVAGRRRHARMTRRHSADCQPSWNSSRTSRSEEHTSELQSQFHLVCRLLLEKKKFEHLVTPAGAAVQARKKDPRDHNRRAR